MMGMEGGWDWAEAHPAMPPSVSSKAKWRRLIVDDMGWYSQIYAAVPGSCLLGLRRSRRRCSYLDVAQVAGGGNVFELDLNYRTAGVWDVFCFYLI